MRPVLMLGAGRMGGAILTGWMGLGPVAMTDVLIRDPEPGATAQEAAEEGAALNPEDEALGRAGTVVLAVKPQLWRSVAEAVEPYLASDAIIVSIAAGISSKELSDAFGGRRVARVMPTIAVALGQGVASIYSNDAKARDRAHDLFDNIAVTADLADEDLMHAATAVSGSGPAYLYALIEAMEAAAVAAGIPPSAAEALVEATITGAAALLGIGDATAAELRAQVTSPGGTTEAALRQLNGTGALDDLVAQAVEAAIRRSRELG